MGEWLGVFTHQDEMIPSFPNFKRLEINDRGEIENYVRRFAPYSDFNFVSLATYDVHGSFELSYLNSNLAVQMRDYITQERFFTFIGTHDVFNTAMALLDRARDVGDRPILRLVPEDAVAAMNGSASMICTEPDPASFDYVYSVTGLADLSSSALANKRRAIRAFRTKHPDHKITDLELCDPESAAGIRAVLHAWRTDKQRTEEEVAVEFSAIERCLTLTTAFKLVALGAFVGGELVGFTINEVVHDGYFMAHFGKALPRYRGLCELLEHETAKAMQLRGCDRMNFQQDLGLPGLRASKRGWRPTGYLKKFILERLT